VKPDDVLAELANAPAPEPPPLPASLEAELANLAPVGTRNPMRQLLLLLGVSLVYGGVLLVILKMRDDMADLPMGWLAGAALGWLFGFIVPSYLALMPRKGSMTPRWRLAAIAAAIASIGFVLLGLFIHPMGKNSVSYGWDRFGEGHTCLEIGLATALVPVVIGAIFLRGALPVGSRWIAAALGAGGGCLGGLVLHLHCHVADGLHVGLIHGGVVIVAALLSAAIVPRATS
jgi:negative regulator of sigma F NrsF-like protein